MMFIGFSSIAVLMERVLAFPSVFGIFLLFSCISSRTEAVFDPESFQQKLVALQKVLDYMNDRPEQMNVDAAYGVTLTEVLTTLTNPNLWIKHVSWRVLSKSKFSPNQFNYWKAIRSMLHGTPTESESDQCFVEIIRSVLKEKCEIPATCIATLKKEDDTTGYPLTHRLLIVQVAKALGCEEDETVSFSSLVSAFCTKILQDFVNLEVWNFPNLARDLMMEQIVLCGMEGYREFVDKHYEDLILTWPHSSGCFSVIEFPSKRKITRRSSSRTDFGCDNHTTGLGAASLAVFIRENIENALSQP